MKSLSNKLYLKKQLYGLRMNEGTAMLEHLNFFNKIISELLTINVKINEEDKVLIFSVLFQSYMITSSPPCSTIRKLSSWRRSHQLFYLMRLEKCKIKRKRQDRVWWSREGKEEKKERKVRARQRRATFIIGKVIGRKTISIGKSGWRRGKLRRQA